MCWVLMEAATLSRGTSASGQVAPIHFPGSIVALFGAFEFDLSKVSKKL